MRRRGADAPYAGGAPMRRAPVCTRMSGVPLVRCPGEA